MKLPIDFRAVLTRIWELMVENPGLKLLSFAFALGIYGFVHGSEEAQRTLPVDVVASAPSGGVRRVLLTPLPPVVRVTVRGPRTLLDEMKADDLGAFHPDLRSGKVDHVEFDPSVIHLPPGVRVEQIDPPSLTLRWEDEVNREIPVQASIAGQPAPGFVIKGAPKVEPPTVHAIGPRSLVDVVQFARVAPFDVTGLDQEKIHEHVLALDRPPPRVEFTTQIVTVKVEVAREEMQRIFVKVPVQVVGVPRGVLSPAEVDVKVDGPPELVRTLRPEQVVPTVDLRSAGLTLTSPGSARLPVVVGLEGCRASVQPQMVVVRW
ncbi:MAG TPA: YbbR-like domain-containing protein [Polyangiaceae bacterium]|nr:YbbR-like domain-containing protein [Polyangiaceae bacterium]